MNLDNAVALSTQHLAHFGLSDITQEQLEWEVLQAMLADFMTETRARVNRGNVHEMAFTPIKHILSPKNRTVFDYRKAAIIDAGCLAKFTAIVLMAAEEIEAARIPVSEEIVFSYRFAPNGTHLFDQSITYQTWREKVKQLANASDCAYVVQCDIASFYDRVNLHRLESTLQDIGVESSVSRLLNDLLLLWSKKDSYGLPVGNAASRILAEAAMIDIDQYLVSEGVRFIRYVDDFRFFAPDLLTAQRWLNLLTTRLFRNGLMLNTGKTRIYPAHKDEDEVEPTGATAQAEAVIREVTQLAGGYNRIARTFVMPTEDKFEAFKDIDIRLEIGKLNSVTLPDFFGLRQIIIASLVQAEFDLLEELARLCSEYLFSLDYFLDMLKKNADKIPSENRERVADFYAEKVFESAYNSLDWHTASLASFLGSTEYFRKPALMRILRTRNIETSSYPSMIALEGLRGNVSRAEFNTIREWFENCDRWEKRRIMSLSSALPFEERKAWGKAIKPTLGDDFLSLCMARRVAAGV